MLRGCRNTIFLGKAWETHRSHARCHLQGTNSPAHQGHCPFVSPIIRDRQKEEWLQLCRGQSPEGLSEGFVRLGGSRCPRPPQMEPCQAFSPSREPQCLPRALPCPRGGLELEASLSLHVSSRCSDQSPGRSPRPSGPLALPSLAGNPWTVTAHLGSGNDSPWPCVTISGAGHCTVSTNNPLLACPGVVLV